MTQTVSANTLAPQTELEAVNAMLSSLGEDALTSLDDTGMPAEGAMAIAILRNATREFQVRRWKFNTEFGYQLVPTAGSPFTWTNGDATTKVLNIFKLPTGVVAFDVASSATANQSDIDVSPRMSVQYKEVGVYVTVLYDRKNNCDGIIASTYPFLYINPVWMFGFESTPESFRAYITACASRRLAAKFLGSTELSNISKPDEQSAWRYLVQDQGEDDSYNIFDNYDVLGAMGTRPTFPTGVFDNRSNLR